MPLTEPELYGTDESGNLNEEYCIYCFKDGEFLQDVTMDEMIEHCLGLLDEFNKDAEVKMSREEALVQMKEFFPHLKRWKTK